MEYIKLLRPTQWSKNLFVFLPLFFAQSITDLPRLCVCCAAFVAMCLASSSVYILNDIMDVEYDRCHPQKCHRPIASGRVSVGAGWIMYGITMLSAVAIAWCIIANVEILIVIGIYLLLSHAYSLWLKHISILDVMIVALGFVLRIIAGAVAVDVQPSHWIIIMTFLLALFLVVAKRRDDVQNYEESKTTTRRNVKAYNKMFLDSTLVLVAAVTMVCYILYTVDDAVVQQFDCNYVYSTAIFVLAGILRYLQLTLVEEKSWSPTLIIARDPFMQCCIVGWLVLFGIIIYG